MATATIADTITQINSFVPEGWSCKKVSWEDTIRTLPKSGVLSKWGPGITDVRLYDLEGQSLFVLRPDNWNERLGRIKAAQIGVITGNEVRGTPRLQSMTMLNYLRNLPNIWQGRLGGGGLMWTDEYVNIRFQLTFIPIDKTRQRVVYVETYNYNTLEEDDPRNAIIITTPQGSSIHQDKPGPNRIGLHARDPDGSIHEYLMKLSLTDFGVGAATEESEESIAEAVSKGEATSAYYGVKAMGQRCNAVLLTQVPLRQKPRMRSFGGGKTRGLSFKPQQGKSTACRVSHGPEVPCSELGNKDAERDPQGEVTSTLTLYYGVADGVPSPEDIALGHAELEALYASCEESGARQEKGWGTSTMSVTDQIAAVQSKYPYTPPACSSTEFPQ